MSDRETALRALAAEDWAMPEPGPVEAGFYTPEDGPGVARLFFTVYGGGYPVDTFYLPERLTEENRAGRIRSVVARNRAGQVVSHIALYRSSPPNPRLYEYGLGLTLPSYRGTLAFGRCNQLLLTLPGSGEIDAIFGEAVSNHMITQRLCRQARIVETALEPALMPAEAYVAEASAAGRVGCVMGFRVDRDRRRLLRVPPAYREVVPWLLEGMGLDRELDEGVVPPTAGESRLETVRFDHAGVARCTIEEAGVDLAGRLAGLEGELRHDGFVVLQCFVPLAEPWAGTAVEVLSAAGFFLGGLLPVWFGGDGLLMLKLFVDPQFDAMQLYSQRSRDLRELVRGDWQRSLGG